jgi:hypothetical protein
MTRVKREFRDEKIQRINQNAPESYRNNTHERFYLVYEPQNRSRMLLRDSSPGDISLPLLHVFKRYVHREKKKSISTHRNFTRNGRRANHRGLLLLNILLFAQGNLGAGKRGSRDREGHSVRYIYKEIVQLSLSLSPCSFLVSGFCARVHYLKTISAPSLICIFLPSHQREPKKKGKDKKTKTKQKFSPAREKNRDFKKEVVKHTSEIKRARIVRREKERVTIHTQKKRETNHARVEYHRR